MDGAAFGFHFLKLFSRIAIFALIVGVGVWIYLVKQAGTENFQTKVKSSLQEKFGAEEIVMKGFKKQQGKLNISRMAMIGGDDTFFTGLELRALTCRMGLLDGISKEWDPGQITISRMELGLRAGADSDEAAESISKILFKDTGRLAVNSVVVADMSIRWGFSERTRGQILNSRMIAQPPAKRMAAEVPRWDFFPELAEGARNRGAECVLRGRWNRF